MEVLERKKKKQETVSDNDERLVTLKRRPWFGYARALAIRDRLESLFVHPQIDRMPNLAIIGETNNGKSMLLQNFYKRHPQSDQPESDKSALPILMIETPPEPDENRLYEVILEELFASGSPRELTSTRLSRLKVILRNLETRMIVFDNIHNALGGSLKRQQRFLHAIRYMSERLKICFVVAGIPEALNFLASDKQSANRFEPVFLPLWKLDQEYQQLLTTIEQKISLRKPSVLAEPKLARRILDVSEGTIGEILSLVRRLAEAAIISGEERITEEMLKPESLASLGWVAPSQRTMYQR